MSTTARPAAETRRGWLALAALELLDLRPEQPPAEQELEYMARSLRADEYVLADSVRPTPQSRFLRRTAALNVSRAALTEAPAAGAKELSCTLARPRAETLAPDAARQYLEYVDQLGPFAEKQVASYRALTP